MSCLQKSEIFNIGYIGNTCSKQIRVSISNISIDNENGLKGIIR